MLEVLVGLCFLCLVLSVTALVHDLVEWSTEDLWVRSAGLVAFSLFLFGCWLIGKIILWGATGLQ